MPSWYKNVPIGHLLDGKAGVVIGAGTDVEEIGGIQSLLTMVGGRVDRSRNSKRGAERG